MNLSYVSGFFDADGYVTLIKLHSRDITHSPVVGFTNTKLELISGIKAYLFDAYGIKGFISKKKAAKTHHSMSYDLKYCQDAALRLCALLKSHHPIKKERMSFLRKGYKLVVKRNGKYTPENLKELQEFHSKFFA